MKDVEMVKKSPSNRLPFNIVNVTFIKMRRRKINSNLYDIPIVVLLLHYIFRFCTIVVDS